MRRPWETQWLGIEQCFRTLTPGQHVKMQPAGSLSIVPERRIDRLTYRESFTLEGASAAVQLPPGPLEWLDWDHRNRLIALSGGRVWAADTCGIVTLDMITRRVTILDDHLVPRFRHRGAGGWAPRWAVREFRERCTSQTPAAADCQPTR